MGHPAELGDDRGVEPWMPVAVHVAPHAGRAVEVAVAGRIDEPGPCPVLDEQRLVLLHLREGMPHVVAVECLESAAGRGLVVSHGLTATGRITAVPSPAASSSLACPSTTATSMYPCEPTSATAVPGAAAR